MEMGRQDNMSSGKKVTDHKMLKDNGVVNDNNNKINNSKSG